MKKAQMEIVGLLVIVIIIVVVIFFMASFSIRDAEQQPIKTITFQDTHAVSNFGPILMESSSNCLDSNFKKLQVKELLEICLRKIEFTCGEINACEKLNQTIENITNSTLDVWNYNYVLTITNQVEENITNIQKNCLNTRNSITNTIYIPVLIQNTQSRATLTLRLCTS